MFWARCLKTILEIRRAHRSDLFYGAEVGVIDVTLSVLGEHEALLAVMLVS
jgi:hypothetical protein